MLKPSSLKRLHPWQYRRLRGQFQRVGAAERAARAEAERIAGLPAMLRALATACHIKADGIAYATFDEGGPLRVIADGPIDEVVAIMHFIRNVRNG